MITTVIPTYVRDSTDLVRLKRALDSVSSQTLSPDEIVISDDTKDEILALKVQELGLSLPLKVKYLIHPGLSNASRNTNYAVTNASSEIIHILHQDDWITRPNFYAEVYEAMVVLEMPWVLAKGVTSGTQNNPKFANTLTFGFNSIGGPSALVVRKNDWIPLDGEFLLLPDVVQFFQLKAKLGLPYITREPCVEYGTGDHKMTHRISDAQIDSDIRLLFKKNIVNSFPFLTFLTGPKYWGTHLQLVCLSVVNNQSLRNSIKFQAWIMRKVCLTYSKAFKLKNAIFCGESIFRMRSHP